MPFKIFIVDDDPPMREMLKDFCVTKYSDSEVHDYATGEAALEDLYRKPDVVILDYNLDSVESKAMDGIEVLKRIKDLLPNVPIIFLSGQENQEIAGNTIKYGAFDYIVKNENAFHRLEIMINNATGHLSLHKQLSNQKVFNIILIALLIAALISLFASNYF